MHSNPYRVGGSVGASEAFVGREKILKDIGQIVKESHHNALVLYGQRRIGKTSILTQLKAQLSEEYCVIFFDWQDKEKWPLRKVLEELSFILSDDDALSQEKPTLANDPGDIFKQWLCELLNPQNKPLVFLFDEFDVIATAESADEITTYFARLLNLSPQHLNWVFVIGGKIEQFTSEAITKLFGNMESRFISNLTQKETEELVRLSEKEQTLQWQENAVRKVYQLTNGHPYFTQRLCSDVWLQLHQNTPSEKTPLVTPQNVSDNVSKTLEASHSILESLWLSLSIQERVVAAALTKKEWIKFVTQLEQSSKKLQEARDLLIEWKLIKNEKGNYRFSVEMIRLWIEKNKSYYDELDSIEPHAQEIYKTAKQLNEEKRFKNALVLLEQVLALNPYHTKATQLSADILKEEKQFQQAQQKLENLYQYNPQAAQEALVDVLLKLASSSDDEKEQLELYQRVKEIEPNHVVAQNKVQEIENWQQERKLGQRVKKFYQAYQKQIWQKQIWQIILFALTLLGTYVYSLQYFPLGITLEVEKDNDNLTHYTLTGIPSAKSHQLQSITVSPNSSYIHNERATFKYRDYKEVSLSLRENPNTPKYSIDVDLLRQKLSTQNFEYPYRDEEFNFTFSFEFKDEEKNRMVDFECQAITTDNKSIECQVKQSGYLSIFRGIPWYGIGIVLGFVLIILIEVFFAMRKPDDSGYGY